MTDRRTADKCQHGSISSSCTCIAPCMHPVPIRVGDASKCKQWDASGSPPVDERQVDCIVTSNAGTCTQKETSERRLGHSEV